MPDNKTIKYVYEQLCIIGWERKVYGPCHEYNTFMLELGELEEEQLVYAILLNPHSEQAKQLPRIECTACPSILYLGELKDTGDGYHFVLTHNSILTDMENNRQTLRYTRITNECLMIQDIIPLDNSSKLAKLIEVQTKLTNSLALFQDPDNPGFIGYIHKENNSACYIIKKGQGTIVLDPSIKNVYTGTFVLSKLTKGTFLENRYLDYSVTIVQKEKLDFISPLCISAYKGQLHYEVTWISYAFDKSIFEAFLGIVYYNHDIKLKNKLILSLQTFYVNRKWLISTYYENIEKFGKYYSLCIILPNNVILPLTVVRHEIAQNDKKGMGYPDLELSLLSQYSNAETDLEYDQVVEV